MVRAQTVEHFLIETNVIKIKVYPNIMSKCTCHHLHDIYVTQNVKALDVLHQNRVTAGSSLWHSVCLRAALLPAVVHTQFILSDPKHAAAAGAKQHWRSCDEQSGMGTK
jgi:hypothetical protein